MKLTEEQLDIINSTGDIKIPAGTVVPEMLEADVPGHGVVRLPERAEPVGPFLRVHVEVVVVCGHQLTDIGPPVGLVDPPVRVLGTGASSLSFSAG